MERPLSIAIRNKFIWENVKKLIIWKIHTFNEGNNLNHWNHAWNSWNWLLSRQNLCFHKNPEFFKNLIKIEKINKNYKFLTFSFNHISVTTHPIREMKVYIIDKSICSFFLHGLLDDIMSPSVKSKIIGPRCTSHPMNPEDPTCSILSQGITITFHKVSGFFHVGNPEVQLGVRGL